MLFQLRINIARALRIVAEKFSPSQHHHPCTKVLVSPLDKQGKPLHWVLVEPEYQGFLRQRFPYMPDTCRTIYGFRVHDLQTGDELDYLDSNKPICCTAGDEHGLSIYVDPRGLERGCRYITYVSGHETESK